MKVIPRLIIVAFFDNFILKVIVFKKIILKVYYIISTSHLTLIIEVNDRYKYFFY